MRKAGHFSEQTNFFFLSRNLLLPHRIEYRSLYPCTRICIFSVPCSAQESAMVSCPLDSLIDDLYILPLIIIF